MAELILAIVIVAAVVALGVRSQRTARKPRSPRAEVEHLRRQFFRQIHQPKPRAAATLERLLSGARERHPGHDEVWYLRRVLADLERDRR